MRKGYEALLRSPAFSGIDPGAIGPLLDTLGAFERGYEKGEVIRHPGDKMEAFPIVLAGSVRATLVQGDRRQIVSWFDAGEPFAEAVPTSLGRCPVEIAATRPSRVLFIPASALSSCKDPEALMLRSNLMVSMSQKVAGLSSKLGLLSEPRLADRVLGYVRTLPSRPDGTVLLPLKYKELAEYLGVNKASLSRTIRVMEDEGIIEAKGRVIKVLREGDE